MKQQKGQDTKQTMSWDTMTSNQGMNETIFGKAKKMSLASAQATKVEIPPQQLLHQPAKEVELSQEAVTKGRTRRRHPLRQRKGSPHPEAQSGSPGPQLQVSRRTTGKKGALSMAHLLVGIALTALAAMSMVKADGEPDKIAGEPDKTPKGKLTFDIGISSQHDDRLRQWWTQSMPPTVTASSHSQGHTSDLNRKAHEDDAAEREYDQDYPTLQVRKRIRKIRQWPE